jgi:hypothetical protein
MKSLITIALLTVSMSSFAIELQAYKDGTTSTVTLADASVESAFASNTPVCLKDGSKILGVNKEFKAKGLGYRDCSNGAAAVRKHKALGYKVTVIKLAELSDTMIRNVLKK